MLSSSLMGAELGDGAGAGGIGHSVSKLNVACGSSESMFSSSRMAPDPELLGDGAGAGGIGCGRVPARSRTRSTGTSSMSMLPPPPRMAAELCGGADVGVVATGVCGSDHGE